jgi:UDPglucose 6-dehydrogenase
MPSAAEVLPRVRLCETAYEVAEGADGLLLATEWNEFKQLDFNIIYQSMRTPVIMDSRNLWDGDQLRAIGFTYFSIGRGYKQNGPAAG